MEATIILLEKKIIYGIFINEDDMKIHYKFLDPDLIKDAFIRKIFVTAREIYNKEGTVVIDKLFYSLPPETRKQDMAKCTEIMLYE